MIEQLPDITADKGIQEDMRKYVKHKIENTTLRFDEFGIILERIMYQATIYGLSTGFRYGWILGGNKMKDELEKSIQYYKNELEKYENKG